MGLKEHREPYSEKGGLVLSIIIVNYNTVELLRGCLRSIARSACRYGYEVIAVDNASEDGSADMVEAEFPGVGLMRNRKNLGFAKANNLALDRARGRYILLLNQDTIILKDALDRMIEFMDAHPEAGVLGCRVLNAEGEVGASTWDHFPNLWRVILATVNVTMTSGLLWIRIREWLDRRERRWGWLVEASALRSTYEVNRETCIVNSCCLMTRRSVLDRVGAFDEYFFITGEEVEWCYRVKKAGFQIWYTKDAQIIHYGKRSYGSNPLHRFLYYPHAYHYLRKHFGRPSGLCYRVILPPILVAGILTHSIWQIVAGDRRAEVKKNLRAFVMALKWAVCWTSVRAQCEQCGVTAHL